MVKTARNYVGFIGKSPPDENGEVDIAVVFRGTITQDEWVQVGGVRAGGWAWCGGARQERVAAGNGRRRRRDLDDEGGGRLQPTTSFLCETPASRDCKGSFPIHCVSCRHRLQSVGFRAWVTERP